MRKIDPITLEIVANMLLSVAEEMGVTLVKTAYSTNIKERKDCSTAIFDGKGNMIAQAEHVPMHLGSMLGVVQAVLKKYPEEMIKPGDMFITNDPYSGGGTHLPDFAMISPVFSENRLVAFVANIAHHSDIGGMVPGSCPANSTSIFQEGIRIPLCYICRNNEVVEQTMDFLLLNTRTPDERRGDLNAQIAANVAGSGRLGRVICKFGTDDFCTCTDALLDYAEKMMRFGIKTLKNGTYTFEDFLDDAGENYNKPVSIRTQVRIEDGIAYISFDGTSPQVPGPLNLTYQGLLTTVFYCFKSVVGKNVFANHGIYRVLKVSAPLGSIVNCTSPAPVSSRIDTAQRVVDVLLGALAQVVPEKVVAACNSSVTSVIFSGTNEKSNKYFVYLETIAGGAGAYYCGDGASGVQVHMTNTSNLPIEALETEYPVLVERYGFIKDSGGAGEYRGGMGICREFRVLSDSLTCSLLEGERHKFAPWGLMGGKSGRPGAFYLCKNGEDAVKLPSKVSGIALKKEDLLTVCTPGAGGFGNPKKRNPENVLRDVIESRVSAETAEECYGITVINSQH
ncbi:MAG: hydantoinase B/oxoprolinase family protein [Clostridiaceae bacterium]